MIRCTRFALFAALGLAMAGPAFAGVDLIATDQLDGHGGALAYRTSGPLENNVPGNVLGGLGSGLAYAGCNTFLALPDRGPNAARTRWPTTRWRTTPGTGSGSLTEQVLSDRSRTYFSKAP